MPPDRSTDPPANSQNLGHRANPRLVPNHLTRFHPARYPHFTLPYPWPSSGPATQLEWAALSLHTRMLHI